MDFDDLPTRKHPWSATFVVDNIRTTVEVCVDGSPLYVSFTGTMEGAGQIVDGLRAATTDSEVIELCDAWDALHLKRWDDLDDVQCDLFESVKLSLILVNGERYGEAADLEDIDDADFSNSDNTIDSREVIQRIEYLEGAFEAAGLDPATIAADDDHDGQDAAKELLALKALEDEAESYAGDWRHGATLVRETYFEDYAEELVKDIGDLPRDMPGYLVIDWAKTAENLKVDYTEVDFDGEAYLVR